MGNFYVNYTVRGATADAVAAFLTGRKAVVAREQDGHVVVFDELSDEQDDAVMVEAGEELSRKLGCAVLAVLNHDDDILAYKLFENGRLTDDYNSSPIYFSDGEEESEPKGGDASVLCRVFGTSDEVAVARILQAPSEEYVFAFERHQALVEALGLPVFAVGNGYGSFDTDEFPDGLTRRDIVGTG